MFDFSANTPKNFLTNTLLNVKNKPMFTFKFPIATPIDIGMTLEFLIISLYVVLEKLLKLRQRPINKSVSAH